MSESSHNPFIRFVCNFGNDLFVQLVAFCIAVSFDTHLIMDTVW